MKGIVLSTNIINTSRRDYFYKSASFHCPLPVRALFPSPEGTTQNFITDSSICRRENSKNCSNELEPSLPSDFIDTITRRAASIRAGRANKRKHCLQMTRKMAFTRRAISPRPPPPAGAYLFFCGARTRRYFPAPTGGGQISRVDGFRTRGPLASTGPRRNPAGAF